MISGLSYLPIVLFYIVYVTTVLSEKVPKPENVRVISLNMGLVLEWDPPQSITKKHFTYTAEFKGWHTFEPVCLSSSSLSCDFSDKVTNFGTYSFRVRAELYGETSEWVETNEFAVDNITIISAPHVDLSSRKGQTEVQITDPPMRRKTLRDVFDNISYIIHFWKKGEAKKEELRREQNRVILPGLEPLVNYCVQVEILYLKNKTSQPSNTTCETNAPTNDVEPWLITVVFMVSFLVVLITGVLIFLLVWYSYRGCRFMYPDPKLPGHLKQYLLELPQSSILLPVQDTSQLKEPCHEVSVFHEEPHGSQDCQQTEGPNRIQTISNRNNCSTEADVRESSRKKNDWERTERTITIL